MAFSPIAYQLDVDVLAGGGSMGLALRSGRLVATVISARSGRHISVQLRAKRKENGRFRACELVDAERIYLDVPRDGGASGREIGQLHLAGKWAGKILPPWEEDFDEARVWAARRVLDVAHGRAPARDGQAEILEGKICLMCGRELTDPESIARNIGPDCWRTATGLAAAAGEHQAPASTRRRPTEEEVIARDTRNAEEEHAEAHMGRYPGDEDFDQVGREEGNAEDGAMGILDRDVDAEVDEMQGKVFDEQGEEVDVRAEIEAELQQTAVKPAAGEDDVDLSPAAPVDRQLFLLRADEDPQRLLEESAHG